MGTRSAHQVWSIWSTEPESFVLVIIFGLFLTVDFAIAHFLTVITEDPVFLPHLLALSPPGPGPGPPHPLLVPEFPLAPPGSPGPDFLGQILIIAMQFSGLCDQSSCNKRW